MLIEFSKEATEELRKIKEATNADSLAAVVRHAMVLYAYLVDNNHATNTKGVIAILSGEEHPFKIEELVAVPGLRRTVKM